MSGKFDTSLNNASEDTLTSGLKDDAYDESKINDQMANLSFSTTSTTQSSAVVRIKNVPSDTTLREAFLIFSLCLDEVTFVDLVHEVESPTHGSSPVPLNNGSISTSLSSHGSVSSSLVIIARFSSLKTAQQVAQLLDDKCLFGTAYQPVNVELISDQHDSSASFANSPYAQTSPSHSSSAVPIISSLGPPQTSNIGMNKRPPLSTQRSRFLFSDPFSSHNSSNIQPPGSSTSSASSSTSQAQTLTSQSAGTLPSGLIPAPQGSSSTPTSATSAQNVLEQLTSPLLASSGKGMLLMDSHSDYDQLVRPWSTGSSLSSSQPNVNSSQNGSSHPGGTPTKSVPESLTINTGLASSIPTGLPTPITNEWDRRRQGSAFFNGSQPTTSSSAPSQSSGTSQSLLVNGGSTPSITSPPFQQQQPQPSSQSQSQPQSQQQQQQQHIPELSLLARVPPPANPADQNPPCNTLYVGNLPPDATELELRTLFQPQKGFRRLSFRTKQNTGNSSSSHHGPMCFVEFEDVAYATRALAELYGRTLPRANGSSSNNKGGIRLSFSKNPLGVRGPGQNRRGSANPGYNSGNNSSQNGNSNGGNSQNGGVNYNGFQQYSYQQMPLSQYPK
ncbi:hypothetical protein OGAPHI_002466 [Ogataea philodendri]|uniref:RRM domain-containing protein n=1 Tax=Ogataea philodendri TaxID=1378263 RepID=A0A9P8PCE0_9ASCO|nr:uncharacterized protein OGAPHI_002466 [Ogataea philodendri]KAH3668712.1 hypothetical protein OGAPHI_002466 [Ogataea philodendri]